MEALFTAVLGTSSVLIGMYHENPIALWTGYICIAIAIWEWYDDLEDADY